MLWRIWQYFSAKKKWHNFFLLFLTIFSLFGLLTSTSCRWFWIYQGCWTRDWIGLPLFVRIFFTFPCWGKKSFSQSTFLKCFFEVPKFLFVCQCSLSNLSFLIFCVFTYLVCVCPSSVSLHTSGFMAQSFQKDFWVFQYFFSFSFKKVSQRSASISTVQKHLSHSSIFKIQKDQKLLWFANPGVLICLSKIHSKMTGGEGRA